MGCGDLGLWSSCLSLRWVVAILQGVGLNGRLPRVAPGGLEMSLLNTSCPPCWCSIKNPLNTWGDWGSVLTGTLACAELSASGDGYVLVQGQWEDKSNAWKQTPVAFLPEPSWKRPEDTGTLGQENIHHYESRGWVRGSRGLWRRVGGCAQAVASCCVPRCVGVRRAAGTELPAPPAACSPKGCPGFSWSALG